MKIYGNIELMGSINKVGSSEIDESEIGNGKVLEYNSTTGKVKYVVPSGGSGGSNRVYYDSLITGFPYPLTVTKLNSMNQKFAPRIVSNWSKYLKCYFMVHETKTGVVHDDLSFLTVDGLVNWINTTFPSFDDLYNKCPIIRVFDKVDSSIPVIDKVYGINRLFNGLVGPGNARSSSTMSCCKIKESWANGFYLLCEMFKAQNPWASFMTADQFHEDQGHFGCWTGKHYLKKFSFPKVGTTVPRGNADKRKFACDNYEGFFSIENDNFTLENPLVFSFREFSRGSNPPLFSTYDLTSIGERRRIRRDVALPGTKYSFVVFFRARGTTKDGETNWAIFIKPLGIDQVAINYFDKTKYDLETVFFNKMTQKNLFKTVSDSEMSNANPSGDSIIVHKTSWLEHPFWGQQITGDSHSRRSTEPWEVFFRLRDKETNKVGLLSNAKIIGEESIYGLRFLVR